MTLKARSLINDPRADMQRTNNIIQGRNQVVKFTLPQDAVITKDFPPYNTPPETKKNNTLGWLALGLIALYFYKKK